MAESSTLCYFATIHASWPWMRQTEDGNGALGSAQFVLPPPASHSLSPFSTSAGTSSAWLVVFDEAPAGFSTIVPSQDPEGLTFSLNPAHKALQRLMVRLINSVDTSQQGDLSQLDLRAWQNKGNPA